MEIVFPTSSVAHDCVGGNELVTARVKCHGLSLLLEQKLHA